MGDDNRMNIKVSPEVFERLSDKKGHETWDSYLLDLTDDEEVQERQADALELIAGMLMLEFDSREDRPSYSVEALAAEARFYARGGETQL